jgi:hypothetical protein
VFKRNVCPVWILSLSNRHPSHPAIRPSFDGFEAFSAVAALGTGAARRKDTLVQNGVFTLDYDSEKAIAFEVPGEPWKQVSAIIAIFNFSIQGI